MIVPQRFYPKEHWRCGNQGSNTHIADGLCSGCIDRAGCLPRPTQRGRKFDRADRHSGRVAPGAIQSVLVSLERGRLGSRHRVRDPTRATVELAGACKSCRIGRILQLSPRHVDTRTIDAETHSEHKTNGENGSHNHDVAVLALASLKLFGTDRKSVV